MKKLLLIIFTAFITSSILPQDVYYYSNYLLYKDTTRVRVNVNGREYGIYNGTVSRGGRYLAGIIVDETAEKYIKAIRGPGLNDFWRLDTLTYAVYSLAENKPLFIYKTDKTIKCGFTDEGNYLVFFNYNVIDFFSIKDSTLQTAYRGYYSSQLLYGNTLMFLDSAQVRNYYSLNEKRVINKEPLSEDTPLDRNTGYTILLDSTRYMYVKIANSGPLTLSLYVDNSLWQKWDVWSRPPFSELVEGHLTLFGHIGEDRTNALYDFDLEANNFRRIFSLWDIESWLDETSNTLYDFHIRGNMVYFQRFSYADEANMIYSYNMETKKFSLLSVTGTSKEPMPLYIMD